VWAEVGLNSFGGPAGQIAVMHRAVVDERRWVSERRFLHALNYCMVLPGPEAQQLATYLGWLLHGVRGGLVAGLLFILPGFAVMMVLSGLYAVYGEVPWVSGLLGGLQAAVVAIVAHAVVRLSGRTLHTRWLRAVALCAFLALFVLAVPFPAVVIAAACAGWLAGRAKPAWLPQKAASRDVVDEQPHLIPDDEAVSSPHIRQARWAAVACLVLWVVPVALLLAVAGRDSVFTQQAVLFSTSALVTFGGAYAVLSYISQQAVATYGWISGRDMAAGLGLAETTPGPLILVVQFVGFLAAYANPGSLPPLLAGVLGACLAVWVTFVPCFMFIFAGAPYVERLRNNRPLHHALTTVSAAVVGVVANLGLWFALTTAFERTTVLQFGPVTMLWPVWSTVDPALVAIMLVTLVLTFALRQPTWRVLLVGALLGLLTQAFG
jgi:chromate transporter